MEDKKALIQTNISLTPRQRGVLLEKEKTTGKSMSELIRDAIDRIYPEIPQLPENTKVTQTDFENIISGWTPELRKKFKLTY